MHAAMNEAACTFQSEIAPLVSVAVKRPREAWLDQATVDAEWLALGYLGRPDFAGAVAQHAAFLERLADGRALDIFDLPADPRTGLDSIYTRDASIATDRGLVLCSMGKDARRGEPSAQADFFATAGIPVLGAIGGAGILEAGDVVWLGPATLAVGRSYRSNDSGIRQLRGLLDDAVEIIVVDLPHWRGAGDILHLMSILSPLDADLALVHSPLMPIRFRETLMERGIALVEAAAEEMATQACNVLAVSPRDVLAVAGNPRTRARLEAAGVRVTEFPAADVCVMGGGGPTCLARPLERRRET